MGRPAAPTKNFDVLQMSHQEMARISDTLDDIYESMKQAGAEWLPVQATGSMVSEELGYEDVDEFEDAINGSWIDFLDILPHVEKKPDSSVTGGWTFKLKPEPAKEDWKPTKMTVRITDSKDLMNSALLKSPYSAFKIPHIEFEIQADGKKQFNTLYNHLASALFNLGQHAEMMQEGESKDLILETCEHLSALLDVQEPYTIVIEDQSGMSCLQPMDNVVVSEMTLEEVANSRQVEPVQSAPALVMQAPTSDSAGMDDVDDVDD
mmetsp:Transcript_25373/g.70978  ORF Transcript_25373/g.70978 Transcript_25373/m.70978 type:complete len:264 (-) Transcript_25373:199-990(-)|eukprot:CAMPEP_0117647934 /NCGR_PEP_ID=MMETSP0804-20121206/113_1 /TAXON_ID=1074897 /ORGANISM="Tetraselmis astigmatica, Strain CCMP880" /LENGTH=263 /DNA_ID=CAMNT_0005453457 /DNA_START=146 /DNA_END=937 /DNA_ORIENTATION=+